MTVPAVPSEGQGFTLLAELEKAGAISGPSLVLPPDLPYDQWEALIIMLWTKREHIQWLIGDAVLYGEKIYGETYAQAMAVTGMAYQTIANWVSTCNRIPRSRRRPGVQFSLHTAVAPLSPNDQKHWLKQAEVHQWTKEQLLDEIHPERKPEKYQSVAAANGTEVLPPEVEAHICACLSCGRLHYDNVDVVQPS